MYYYLCHSINDKCSLVLITLLDLNGKKWPQQSPPTVQATRQMLKHKGASLSWLIGI